MIAFLLVIEVVCEQCEGDIGHSCCIYTGIGKINSFIVNCDMCTSRT